MRHATLKKRIPTLGEAPGTLLSVGEAKLPEASISLFEYGPEQLQETVFQTVAEGLAHQPAGGVLWLNVYGLHQPEVMRAIGQRFGLHALVLEDIMNARQRPKVEDYGDYLFIAGRVFDYHQHSEKGTGRLLSDQIYLVIGRRFVLTFQERPTGVFEEVRERLRRGRGLLRHKDADYLGYSLLDAMIDDYFGVLTEFNERVERMDSTLLRGRDQGVLLQIQRLKRDCLKLRRALMPLREMLISLNRGEHGFFKPETLVYLRDAYDHTMHVIESLEMSREMVGDMLDLYLSTQSHRLNLQMRVLTVLTMIFMPLTLIAGIYGMNFEYMPELKWHYGYHLVLVAMLGIAGGLSWLFWKRRWL
ncbi:magnesium transporter [Chromobacterium sp. LK1]|uniref:magnesium/cobalt transporter CorA n=1 Tax=Chromobacterium sp. LK1 TaxID=1628193 RepID=UPI0006532EA3|nr:magnesium/cobalt transporter CorA [Chromobacterium sp. LK1]KMN35407.1 magnesium transporter [Chromobacterium sp. LK1]